MSVNRSPGATRQKRGEKHPAKFSARWLPAGIIWGPERFFSSFSFFPFSCMVSRLESSTLTLLLTQPLRDGCNSSLSMAPVIEPSEGERESERMRKKVLRGGWGGDKCGSRKEWNSIVISGLSQFSEPVILLSYWRVDILDWLFVLRLISSSQCCLPKFSFISNQVNKLIIIRFTSGYFVNRERCVCLRSGHTPALTLSPLLCLSGLTHFLPTVSFPFYCI